MENLFLGEKLKLSLLGNISGKGGEQAYEWLKYKWLPKAANGFYNRSV